MKKLIRPIITEKSLRLIEESNTYMFLIPGVGSKLSKFMVSTYIEEKYEVEPISIKMNIRVGKNKRFGKSRMTYYTGKQKVAYVRIPADKKLPDFQIKDEKASLKSEEKKDKKKDKKIDTNTTSKKAAN